MNTISLLNARRSRRHLEDEEELLTAEGKRKWINTEAGSRNASNSDYENEIDILKSRIFDLEDEFDRMKNNLRKLNKIVKDIEKKKVQH